MWSSQADISLLAPLADFVGAVYSGTLTYGQLDDKPSAGLSIDQLIQIAGEATTEKCVTLKAGVVNNNLIYESQNLSNDSPIQTAFAGEIIHYAVIQRPY